MVFSTNISSTGWVALPVTLLGQQCSRCQLGTGCKPVSPWLPTGLHQVRTGFGFGCVPIRFSRKFFRLFIFSTDMKYLEHKMTNLPLCSRYVLRPFGNC